jgi:hypothetical protein
MTQLGTLGLQKGELLRLFLVLPLRHLLGPMLRCNPVLREGDLLVKAFGFFPGKC